MLTEEEKKKINTGTPAETESPAEPTVPAAPTAPASPTVPATPETPATPATPATTTTSTPDYTSMVVKDITTFGDKTKREEPKEETTSKVDETSSNVDDTTSKVYETLYKRGYDRLSDILEQARDRYKPETDEERKKRERKEKSKKIVAAITDGLNSLSNLYFTTQYAPNMYDHEKQSTLKPYEERLEKEKKDREANNDKYDALNMKLAENEINSAKTMRELQAALEKRRIEIEKNKRDAEQHDWKRLLMPYQYSSEISKADKAKSDADIAKTKAKYADKLSQVEIDNLESLKKYRDSLTEKNKRGKPSGGGSGGRGGKSNHVAYDSDGNAHYFTTKGDADDFAKAHGTYVYSTSSTSKGFSGNKEVSTTTRTGGYRTRPQKSTKKSTAPGRKPAQHSYKNTKELGY